MAKRNGQVSSHDAILTPIVLEDLGTLDMGRALQASRQLF